MHAASKFISGLSVGVLATCGNDGVPLAATIFFTKNSNDELLFKSRKNSDHMKLLPEGAWASLAAYRHNSTYKKKSGIQIIGKVLSVESVHEMNKMISLYSKAFDGAAEKFNSPEEHLKIESVSTLFKFQPIKYKLLCHSENRSDLEYIDWV